ncbi:Bug family tripartite tricarboxylate transporter substrate binding protein [Azohydromonas lata]|uniref:Tripartite tricarboxylate transporter substrate binding protein n=1 Tax=Azohydromonas lata TaxID=45677 RepID=A0ABU5IKR6_9BURK|nr:tripartite tricarboxylate transporter substrate binding protein [Azohydromonas lata]MDZ5459495.1 tripartite tricarboxylate transporter substrate binding protein [Azohydromonas lata]
MNPTRRFTLGALAAAATLALAGAAVAQDFPSKPVTLVVPFPPGGVTDQIARVLAGKLQEDLRQTVIVDNKPGAGGQIAAQTVKGAPADGHTLFIAATEMFAVNPTLFRKFTYDPLKDFQPVTALISSPLVLVVPKNSPVNSVADLVAASKKKDGGLNFASQGVGSIGHLLGELYRSRSGGDFHHVAYKGSAPALQDLMGGQVDLMFDPVITTAPLIQSGKLKPLAIAATKRAAQLPEVRTLQELGTTGVDASVWFGAVVKAGTPAPAVARLNESLAKALRSPDVVKRFTDQGLQPMPMSPEAFGSFMKEEITRWSALVKTSGASVD